MYARPFIDSLDFARNGRETSGEVHFAKMPRFLEVSLLDALEYPEGVVSYRILGEIDRQGFPYLEVSIAGNCRLRCQRCLGAMEHAIKIDERLLLRDQAGLDSLDENVTGGDEEEHDSILAEDQLDVLNLVEEEILLSLPIAPKHEEGACQAAGGEGSRREEQSPFATLAKLKVVK